MHLNRRHLIGAAGAAGAATLLPGAAAIAAQRGPTPAPSKGGKTTLTADQALALLKEGNRRFVADMPAQGPISRKRRLDIAKGQAPFAVLVSCSDSRVGPEQLFGRGSANSSSCAMPATPRRPTKRWAASNSVWACSALR
jgi:carbonic anhydrase